MPAGPDPHALGGPVDDLKLALAAHLSCRVSTGSVPIDAIHEMRTCIDILGERVAVGECCRLAFLSYAHLPTAIRVRA